MHSEGQESSREPSFYKSGGQYHPLHYFLCLWLRVRGGGKYSFQCDNRETYKKEPSKTPCKLVLEAVLQSTLIPSLFKLHHPQLCPPKHFPHNNPHSKHDPAAWLWPVNVLLLHTWLGTIGMKSLGPSQMRWWLSGERSNTGKGKSISTPEQRRHG